MKVNTNHFVDKLNRVFGSPFLPTGFFKAESDGKGLKLWIGDRDLHIDGKGEFKGSGSNVGEGRSWEVKRLSTK